MPKRTPGADPEKFVRAWQSSSSIEQVAGALGMSTHAVFMRADRYRKAGVPLRRFARPAIDFGRLTDIALEPRQHPDHSQSTAQSQPNTPQYTDNRIRVIK